MLARFRTLQFVAALATLTSLAACSKDDPKPAADPMGMSWTMDGSNVTATTTNKDASGTEIELVGGIGSAASLSVIELSVPKKVGTYKLEDSSSNAIASLTTGSITSGTYYQGETGTITVTSLTATSVVGTFTFTGEGEDSSGATMPAKTITNGKFNIAL